MPIADEKIELPNHTANGNPETEALWQRIRELEGECDRLEQALAASEAERNRYRQAFLDQARAAREFEDMDVASVKAMSAGPVELIE